MPGQVTVPDVADMTGSRVDRRLLIEAFSSPKPATDAVAVPVVGRGK